MSATAETNCPRCTSPNLADSRFCAACGMPLPPADHTLELRRESALPGGEPIHPGDIFANRYKILDKLGSGGMGVVYKAEDQKLMRPVALKFLPPGQTIDQAAKLRFIREAQSASLLDHPNICTVHEIDELDDGRLFIVMAFYSGETLRAKIQRGPLSPEEGLAIMIQVAEGLAKAHGQGIIHRDIKPANIMVTDGGLVKILDFGLAKLSRQAGLTQASALIGTVGYMSPEQARGEEVDERTDIWSSGVVLYELLTGRHPFPGDNERAILHALQDMTPVSPREWRREIPEECERIIWKCMSKEKDRRYAMALSLLQDLAKAKAALTQEAGGSAAERRKTGEVSKGIERRPATVVFAELTGYSELLASLGPEEAAPVLSDCFALFEAVVRRYDGRIARINDGTLLILIGVPTAIEDSPRKALAMAIELLSNLRRFNGERPLKMPLDLRIGVDSGMIITAGTEFDEYGVMGEAVQVASQLKDQAGPGRVYVSTAVQRSTRETFDFERMKPVLHKGTKTPLPVFQLASVPEVIPRGALGAERKVFSVMVGREKELGRIELQLFKLINGQGSIVNIIGEAGIGKSRLIAELSRNPALAKAVVLTGRALSIGKNLSYHPLIEILRNWARIKEGDPPAASAQKLEQAIRSVLPDGVSEAFPFIAAMMGIKPSGKTAERLRGIEGDALERLILKNLRDVLAAISEKKPVIFAVEDLHWSDRTSLETLESLCRLAESHRILFLNVCRPNYPDTTDRFLERIRNRFPGLLVEIALEPLGEADCETLVDNLLRLQGLPPHVRTLITRRAEGNPFFIEEVVHSLIDEGALEIREGRFHVTEKIDSVVIPETIQDILMARIDRLEEETRTLVKIASVIGRNFFYRVLTQVADAVPALDEKLAFLQRVQLIREQRRLEEREYLFEHALIQEAAYESILANTRKELHLRVAAAVESVFADRLPEFYGMLALHYSSGENLDKAEDYLVRAGEEALKSAASNEAIHYYQEALRLYLAKTGRAQRPETIAHLEWNIAKALLSKGHMDEAVVYFDRLLKIWGEKRPRNRPLSVLYFGFNVIHVILSLYLPGRTIKRSPSKRLNDIFEATYQRGMALVTVDTRRMVMDSIRFLGALRKYDLNQVVNGVAIYASASALFFYSGLSFRIGRKLLDYAQSSITPKDHRSLFIYEFYRLAMAVLAGEWDVSLHSDAASLERSVQDGDLFTASGVVFFQGLLAVEKGKLSDALKKIRKLESLGETYENTYARTLRSVLQTRLWLRMRNPGEAVAEADREIPRLNKAGQKFWALHLIGLKAQAQFLLEDLDEARKTLDVAEKFMAREKGITPLYSSSYRVSRFLLDLRSLENALGAGNRPAIARARRMARQSLRSLERNARRCAPIQTEASRLAGVYFWLEGKTKAAFGRWRRGVQAGERLQAWPELGRLYFEIGRRLIRAGRPSLPNGPAAGDLLTKARLAFEGLDLTWDLEELDQVRRDSRS